MKTLQAGLKHDLIEFILLVDKRQVDQQAYIQVLQSTYKDVLNPKPSLPYKCKTCKGQFYSRGHIGPHTKICMKKRKSLIEKQNHQNNQGNEAKNVIQNEEPATRKIRR